MKLEFGVEINENLVLWFILVGEIGVSLMFNLF